MVQIQLDKSRNTDIGCSTGKQFSGNGWLMAEYEIRISQIHEFIWGSTTGAQEYNTVTVKECKKCVKKCK